MSEEDLFALLGINKKLEDCVIARISKNEMFPLECDGIDANVPTYLAEDPIETVLKEIPSYD